MEYSLLLTIDPWHGNLRSTIIELIHNNNFRLWKYIILATTTIKFDGLDRVQGCPTVHPNLQMVFSFTT